MKIISGGELLEDTTHSMAAVVLDVEASPIDAEFVVTALQKIVAEGGISGEVPSGMNQGWRASYEQLVGANESTVDALVVTNASRDKVDCMYMHMRALGAWQLAGMEFKFERLGAARATAAGMMGKIDMELRGVTKTKTKVPRAIVLAPTLTLVLT